MHSQTITRTAHSLLLQMSHDHKKKVQSLMEQLATAKEEAIQHKMELKVERHDKELAQSKVSEITHAMKVAEESLGIAKHTCCQLEKEKTALLQKIQGLEEQVSLAFKISALILCMMIVICLK